MNIWITQIGEPLPLDSNTRKMRTALMADELVRRDHRITWWASAFDHISKKVQFSRDQTIIINDNYKIEAIFGKEYRRNISWQRYSDHRIISKKLYTKLSQSPPPDIMIVSMPDHLTAFQSVRYAQLNNVPVLVDVRDEWPDLFLGAVPGFLRPAARCLLMKDLANTSYLLSHSQAITSMMDSLHRWALGKAGREKGWMDRVFYLGAMPPVSCDADSLAPEIYRLRGLVKNRFVLLYIGTFGKHNDPTIMIEAAASLKKAGMADRFYFIIAGDGKYFNDIAQSAAAFDNVFLPGWLGQNEISFLLSLATVGVLPSTSHRDEFPNKAFTYLSAGIPIITSAGGELKEIVDVFQVGYNYEPNDRDGFIGKIKDMDNDPPCVHKMSERAAAIFNERFHAGKIYHDFADHIEKVAACRERNFRT